MASTRARRQREHPPPWFGADSGLAKALLWGILVGWVAVFVLLGGLALGVGLGGPGVLALGLFGAFFAGTGLGGMTGAIVHSSREQRANRRAAPVDEVPVGSR